MKIVPAAALLLVVGCGAPAGDLRSAEQAATGFLEAHAAGDGERACALVAPETRFQLEQQEQQPCARAVLAVELPEGSTPTRTQVFSRQGVVLVGEQAVFVAELDLGWRVTAAGCTPRGDKPHDCEVQGA